MKKETDLMKLGLYALAGFGAFAVYNRYIAKPKADLGTTEDPMSSFTGTRWQQDTPTGTSWQRGNVFSNAAGSSCGYSSAAGPNYDMRRYAIRGRVAGPGVGPQDVTGLTPRMRMDPPENVSGHLIFREGRPGPGRPGPGGTIYYPPVPTYRRGPGHITLNDLKNLV